MTRLLNWIDWHKLELLFRDPINTFHTAGLALLFMWGVFMFSRLPGATPTFGLVRYNGWRHRFAMLALASLSGWQLLTQCLALDAILFVGDTEAAAAQYTASTVGSKSLGFYLIAALMATATINGIRGAETGPIDRAK